MKVDFSKCKEYPLNIAPVTTELTTIYFLLCQTNIIYIGVTRNLVNRLKQHRKKEFDKVFYISNINDHYILWVEACLIQLLKPQYNKRASQYWVGRMTEQEMKNLVNNHTKQ